MNHNELSAELITDTETLYIKEVMSIPLLKREEEKELLKKAKNGDKEARDKIITGNLRLVVSIANRYTSMGIPILDLVSEGNLGLFKALLKYDETKGVKFATYATYWIHNYIYKYLAANEKNVRIPFEQYHKNSIYRKFLAKLTLELGREPTDKEIMDKLNTLGIELEEMKKIELFNNMTTIEEISNENNKKVFINPHIEKSLEETVIDEKLKDYVDDLLDNNNLSDYEKDVLKLRYGYINNKIYSYPEIGSMYNVTRQRIFEVRERALKKLRLSDDVIDLIDYADRPDETLRFLNSIRNKHYRKVLKKENSDT